MRPEDREVMRFLNRLDEKGINSIRGYPNTIVLVIVLFTIVSRIPFISEVLYHWDSVNFANGVAQFDVLKEHPQPPGYILYIWLAQLVDVVFHDVNQTLVVISIVASAGAVLGIYLLGRALWNKEIGIIASLFLATSPLFWFYGEIALPHTLDLCLILLSLWLLYQLRKGVSRLLWPAVIVLGIVGGVRQQTLVFLLPLALYASWREGWKRIMMAVVLGAVVCLGWFYPLIVNAGGLDRYLGFMSEYSARFQWNTSVLMGAGISGIARNLQRLLPYTLYGLSAAILPFVLLPKLENRNGASWLHTEQARFISLWVGPVLLFYIFIHMGQQGLIFVYLPALFLLGGVIIRDVRVRPGVKAVGVAALILANCAVFIFAPERGLEPFVPRLLTADTIHNSDRYYIERIQRIQECCPQERTLVVAPNWDHARYYLPEYSVMGFMSDGIVSLPGDSGGQVLTEVVEIHSQNLVSDLSAGDSWWLALFDDELISFVEMPLEEVSTIASPGSWIGYAILDGQDVLCIEKDAIAICESD